MKVGIHSINMNKESLIITVENLKGGSNQAKEFIFLNYYEHFLQIAIRVLESKEDAEDVLSNSLFKIFNKIQQLKDPQQFLGWCQSMITRDCYNYIRTRKIHSDSEYFDMGVPADFSKIFDIELVKHIIDELPQGYKQVLQLHCIQGYSSVEVAEILNINPGTVRSQLYKARKVLRKKLSYEY
jgi:RNA polymerase sigma-70 factor (ECF subfamily)